MAAPINSEVELLSSGGEVVGTAPLATIVSTGKGDFLETLREKMHGSTLRDIEVDHGPHVIIVGTEICTTYGTHHYEGVNVGKGTEPTVLKDLKRGMSYI